MVDAGTLATTAQVLLAIGADPNAAQALEANTNIWILYAEADIEKELGVVGIVANYSDVTANLKQWIANLAADRAAWYAFKQDPDNWELATTQSKQNLALKSWADFIGKLKDDKADLIAALGLTDAA